MTLRRAGAFFLQKSKLLRRIEALEAETTDLRARLIAAQSAKAVAEAQAELLRQEKERLRTRIAAQKKTAKQARLVTDQLRTKFQELQDELNQLKAKSAP